MNLKVWSIVMMVSMCVVFLAPSVSMNASAFGDLSLDEFTVYPTTDFGGVVGGCMAKDNETFTMFNSTENSFVPPIYQEYIGNHNSSNGINWSSAVYPASSTYVGGNAYFCGFKEDGRYYGLCVSHDTNVIDYSKVQFVEGDDVSSLSVGRNAPWSIKFAISGHVRISDIVKIDDTYHVFFMNGAGVGINDSIIYQGTTTDLNDSSKWGVDFVGTVDINFTPYSLWTLGNNDIFINMTYYQTFSYAPSETYAGGTVTGIDFAKKGSYWYAFISLMDLYVGDGSPPTFELTNHLLLYKSSSFSFPNNTAYCVTEIPLQNDDEYIFQFYIYSDDVYKDSRDLTDDSIIIVMTSKTILSGETYSYVVTGDFPLSSIERMIQNLEDMLPLIVILMFFIAIAGFVGFKIR